MPVAPAMQFRVADRPEVAPKTVAQLTQYAAAIGLTAIAPGRFSWLFVFDIYAHSVINGVDPGMILAKLRALENGDVTVGTKAATQFTREPLEGLWHKHFFSAHFIAHNLVNHHSGDRLNATVDRVMDPEKYPVISRELIDQLIHEVIEQPIVDRNKSKTLTGEWIVFAKHSGQNIYLTLALHPTDRSGDKVIYDRIRTHCFDQFPFLSQT